jgi:hypothetical protein
MMPQSFLAIFAVGELVDTQGATLHMLSDMRD